MDNQPDPASLFLAYGSVALLLLLGLSILFGRIGKWWARKHMSSNAPPVEKSGADQVVLPLVPPTSIAAPPDHGVLDMPRISRYLSDPELITLLAAQRRPNGKYRFSANEIVLFLKDQRADTLARVRAVREGAPVEYPPRTPAQQALRHEIEQV